MKSLYRHKQSGDIFAIEIGELGNVRSTSGPLFSDDLDPKLLDYDEYWNTEVQAKLDDFMLQMVARDPHHKRWGRSRSQFRVQIRREFP